MWGSLAAWEECDWEVRSRNPRYGLDGLDRFGGWGMWVLARVCGAGHMSNAHLCTCACVRVYWV